VRFNIRVRVRVHVSVVLLAESCSDLHEVWSPTPISDTLGSTFLRPKPRR